MTVLANWTALISWRRAVASHWTERARLLWPARITAGLIVVLVPAILLLAHEVIFPRFNDWWITDCVAAFLGALLAGYAFARELFPRLDPRTWWNQVIAGEGFRFGYLVALLAAALLMPDHFALKMLVIAGSYLAFHLAIQFGLLLKYLRIVKFAIPADERLLQIVNTTATRMNVTVRATWRLGGPMATAFAFPVTRELAFSNRLLEICEDEEVSSICAHELAHLKESKAIVAARLLGSLALFPLIFTNPAMHQFGLTGILFPYLGMFIIRRFSLWLSQHMEKRADQLALPEQSSDGVYARALEKLYRENQIPAVIASNNSTHPHLFDRMLAAGITPEYPRPAKPKRFTALGWLYALLFVGLLGMLVFRNAFS